MRFICFGAGAIGTYIGGKLLLGGNDVVFLEQKGSIDPLREQGMSIEDDAGVHRIEQVNAYWDLGELFASGKFDYAIVALKAYDTQRLIQSLIGFYEYIPPIICFQNGVENEPLFTAAFGAERVIAGTITTAVNRLDIGSIRVEKVRGIGLAKHDETAEIIRVFNAANLLTSEYQNAQDMKWSKLLTNILANASAAIVGMTPAEIYTDLGLFSLEMAQIKEALMVMRELGCKVTDLPGTPVKALAWFAAHVPTRISHQVLRPILSRGRGNKMPSLYIDLAQGKKVSEVTYLNGAVARYGESLGIPTPVNQRLTEILNQVIEDTDMRERFFHNPQQLLNML